MRSRKKNPGLYRTRKAAVLDAIERTDRDLVNRSGAWYVVGGNRRWGVVALRPNGPFFGPITAESSDRYRRWYC